jgi:hypothetical protein
VQEASGRTSSPQEGGPSDTYLRVTGRGSTGPVPAAAMSGVFAAYFLVEAFEPFSLFRLVLGIATAALTLRLALSGTLVADKEGIKWHTLMRTWQWPYAAVDHFELAVRSPVPSDPPAQVMLIHLADGRAQWLGALQEPLRPAAVDPSRRRPALDRPKPKYPALNHLDGLRFWRRPPAEPLDEVVLRLNRIVTGLHENGKAAREAG